MNAVNIVGRIAKDIDVRRNSDSIVARFSIAVQREFKNKDGKYDADFINCIAFGKTAEFLEKYFSKGMRIGLSGRIQTGSYTNKDGNKIYTTDVVVEKCEFVESKGESQTTQNTTNSTPKADNDFMNIPAEIDEELPFS